MFLLCYITDASDSFVLNRVAITKNTAKQVSVRFHGQTPDLVLFHAILRFSSPINQHHNALLIDESSLKKYQKILVERSSKITVSSRTVKRALSYLTAHDNTTSDANGDGIADKLQEMIRSASMFGFGGVGASTSYDGVLLLDEFSAIWNEFDIMVFSKSLLTFSYSVNGSLSSPESFPEYTGITRLSCDRQYESDHCLVITEELHVNDQLYPHYRVLIDLDSSVNLLPIDLYLQWVVADEQSLTIRLSEEDTLHLNSKFRYDMHQSNIILIGIDLIHQFPRVEFSVIKKTFQLHYYESIQNHQGVQHTIKVLFVPLNLLLLICLFRFGTGYNYQILPYMIQFGKYARRTHFFAFRQVLFEVLAIVVCWIALIASLFFTEPFSNWTLYQERKCLFATSILTNSIVMIYLLFAYNEPNCALYNYYFGCKTKKVLQPLPKQCQPPIIRRCVDESVRKRTKRLVACNTPTLPLQLEEEPLPYAEVFSDIADRTLAEKLHCTVVKLYHDPIVKLYTPVTITRNSTFVTLILVGIQMIFNFYSEENNIYLLVIVCLSLAIHYYQMKYIAISIVYLSLFYPGRISRSQRTANRTFMLSIGFNIVSRVTGIYSAYRCIYLAYFDTINSTHSVATINAYILSLIASLALIAVTLVSITFDRYADPLIEAAIDQSVRIQAKRALRTQ